MNKCKICGGFISIRRNYPPYVRDILNNIGNDQIKEMYILRQPVNSIIKKIINYISFGEFEKNMNNLNYDDVYHLSLVVKINKSYYKIEKNEVINIEPIKLNNKQDKIKINNYNGDLTLNELFNNAKKLYNPTDDFYLYDFKYNNCQHFIYNLLLGSNLMTEEYKLFIMQDATSLIIKSSPLVGKISNIITDTGALFDRLIYGSQLNTI
jgi:hypothetical protein